MNEAEVELVDAQAEEAKAKAVNQLTSAIYNLRNADVVTLEEVNNALIAKIKALLA
jgi:hypothetical protein